MEKAEFKVEEILGTENVYSLKSGLYGIDPGSSYLIDSNKRALIEAGSSNAVNRLIRNLTELGVSTLDYIALTHIHLDHAGATRFLTGRFQGAKVLVHKMGPKYLVDPTKLEESVREAVGDLFKYYGGIDPVPEDRMLTPEDGRKFDLGGDYGIKVVESPGHAPHHLAYFEPRWEVLFVGDALGLYFPDSDKLVPGTPPPGFDLEKNLKTIEKFRELDPKFLAYTHVGWSDEPKDLLNRYEKLLKSWVEEIEDLREDLNDDEEVRKRIVDKYSSRWFQFSEDDEYVRKAVRMDVDGVFLYLDRREGR